jgi:uncharacterized repeat protein (TIGR03803 family)
MVLTGVPAASAQNFNVIHNFTGGNDGSVPMAGLSMDHGGNLYGTASSGGVGFGTVFRLSNRGGSWFLTPLYSFAGGMDGGKPLARVTIGADGTLYGTTYQGRATVCTRNAGCGTVFNLKPTGISVFAPWIETVLYRFQGIPDGANPSGDVIFDQAGNLYGTTQLGGNRSDVCAFGGGCGTVYELSPSNGGWTENVLYRFDASGYQPKGGVVFDAAGNLYGTTFYCLPDCVGTVFELTPTGSGWMQTILYTFIAPIDWYRGLPTAGSIFRTSSDFQPATTHNGVGGTEDPGWYPAAGLVLDTSDNLYGATTGGGGYGGGAVFELMFTGSSWSLNVLGSFRGDTGPYASLLRDAAGNLYGTTVNEGSHDKGTVFELTPFSGGYFYTLLHEFTGGSDGGLPYGSLVMDADGNLYGTASLGGSHGAGVVFQVSP